MSLAKAVESVLFPTQPTYQATGTLCTYYIVAKLGKQLFSPIVVNILTGEKSSVTTNSNIYLTIDLRSEKNLEVFRPFAN